MPDELYLDQRKIMAEHREGKKLGPPVIAVLPLAAQFSLPFL